MSNPAADVPSLIVIVVLVLRKEITHCKQGRKAGLPLLYILCLFVGVRRLSAAPTFLCKRSHQKCELLVAAVLLCVCLHTAVESQQALELISNKFHVQTLFLEAHSCLRNLLLLQEFYSIDLDCRVSRCREQMASLGSE